MGEKGRSGTYSIPIAIKAQLVPIPNPPKITPIIPNIPNKIAATVIANGLKGIATGRRAGGLARFNGRLAGGAPVGVPQLGQNSASSGSSSPHFLPIRHVLSASLTYPTHYFNVRSSPTGN